MDKKDYCRDMLSFIEQSPSCFHVIENLCGRFRDAGFEELPETADWRIQAGGRYFTVRNDSSLIAFQLPPKSGLSEIAGFHIVASHSDSPSFKVKESAELDVEQHYTRLNTEPYGGMILSAWLDRPLSVAGRVVIRKEGQEGRARLETRLVNVDRDLLVIPNLAVHMNRDVNKGYEYNPQTDMLPLFADCAGQEGAGKNTLLQAAAEAAGVRAEEILGHDLFLYVREKGRLLGAREEFVLSPKLDDLQCVYTSAQAFLETAPQSYLSFCAVFDNEEVGSGTRQGAGSTFLEDTLARVSDALGADRSDYLRWVADGFLISADNAHALHPNHPEKADLSNRPYLNGGIVIKYHGGQRYTTDAVSGARMKDICDRAGVPYQIYANRSDIAGGSTLGHISAAHVSVPSVDIGLPQLAMHSAVETGGARDTEYALKALRVFYGE